MEVSIIFLVLLFVCIGIKGNLGIILFVFTLLVWFIIADFTFLGIIKSIAIMLLAGYVFNRYHKLESE